MNKIITFLLLTITLAFSTEYKVVFNLTSGNESQVSKSLLGNINLLEKHYKSQGDTLKSAVVISGSAYMFFRNDVYTQLDSALEQLSENGVEFKVCSIGMKKHNIKKSSLESYVIPAFNRTAALIEYQNAGYAYIEIQ